MLRRFSVFVTGMLLSAAGCTAQSAAPGPVPLRVGYFPNITHTRRARLVREANGRIVLDERDLWQDGKFTTACVIVSAKFLSEHPDLVSKWLAAHVELTERINAEPATAKQKLNAEIERLTGKALPAQVLDDAKGLPAVQ